MVPTDSHRISRVPCYLGSLSSFHNISSTGLAPSMTGLSRPFDYIASCSCRSADLLGGPTTPIMQRLPAITHDRFSLFRVRSPLLTESLLFSLPVGTEMFHFPTLPLSTLYSQMEMMGHDSHRVPPFGNPRIKALLAAPRGFSQPHTTFFGFWCLGIRHLHLIIFLHYFFFQRCSRSLCSSQDTGGLRSLKPLTE